MEEKTIEKITRIGYTLMNEKGFDKVTINEICSAANISKHTFYYYFESKEDILNKIYETRPMHIQTYFNEIVSLESPLEQYIALISLHANHIEKMGVEIAKKTLTHHLNKEFQFKNSNKSIHPLRDLAITFLKKAQQSKEILNTSNPLYLFRACNMALIGLAQIWAIENDDTPLTERYIELVKVILNVNENKL